MGLWTTLAAIAVLATASLTPGAAISALRSTDPGALVAVGSEHGAGGLVPLLTGGDSREVTRAAIEASAGADDGWLTLVPLAALAAGPDRSLAAPAAFSAERIARAFDRDRMLELDVPDEAARAALAAWRSLGATADRWADVRVHALEVTTHLHAALGADAGPDDAPYDLDALIADADPEVRRAALELLPQPIPTGAIPKAAAILRGDTDPIVAIVAAQVLCAGLAFDDEPTAILAAIDSAGMTRLAALIVDSAMPPGAIADAKRCVAAGGDTK